MQTSDIVSLIAVIISLFSFFFPIYLSRPKAEIKEIKTFSISKNDIHVYLVVYNGSSKPLNFSGATLNEIPLYRHQHMFTKEIDQETKKILGQVRTTEFPVYISPYTEKALLLEFADDNGKEIPMDSPVELELYADCQTIEKDITINQCSLTLEQVVKEI